MTTIGKVWTAGIAYVALAVGAGLSIMYNILDTMQVRGPQFDWADLVTAVAAPGMVVLMVEVFVSRWWIGQPWYIQAIRWSGVAVIGGVAMRASWTHGHDWMASRGQTQDVAMAWPLAIDLLAIMATALILIGRHRGHVATMATVAQSDGHEDDSVAKLAMANGGPLDDGQDVATVANWNGHVVSTELAMAAAMAIPSEQLGQDEDVAMVGEDDPVATEPMSLAYLATLEAEVEAWNDGKVPEPECRTFASKVPDDAAAMIRAWDPKITDGRDLDAMVAAQFGKSARTARRWRSIVTGQPTSGS